MLTNIFLKFNELAKVRDENAPFSNNYGATAAAVLTDFLSVEDISKITKIYWSEYTIYLYFAFLIGDTSHIALIPRSCYL